MSNNKLAIVLGLVLVLVSACVPTQTGSSQNSSSQTVSDPVLITGAGDITATVEAYRQALGGENNGGEVGSKATGFREINWDSLPDELSAPNFYLSDFFNAPEAPRARGAVITTPGTGLMVSADSDNPTGTLPRFGNLNPSYTDSFVTFSEERLFLPVGSNIADLTFFVPGTTTPAVVLGFGAVYVVTILPLNTLTLTEIR